MSAMDLAARVLAGLRGGTSIRAQLARASVWSLLGTGVQQFFAMISSIFVARILGRTAFGELGVVRSTTLVFAALAGAGLSTAVTRYVAALRHSDPERAGRVLGLILTVAWTVSGTATLVCIALSHVIARNAFHAEQLAFPISISALAVVLSIVGGTQIGVVAGCERFDRVAMLFAAEGVFGAIGMVGGAWLGRVNGAVIGFVVGTLLAFLWKQQQMNKACRDHGIVVTTKGIRAELPILGAFVVPVVLIGVATQPAEWLSRVLLARGVNGLAEVGLFTAAFNWAQLVTFIPGQIAGPAMPMLTKVLAAGDYVTFRRLLKDSVLLIGGVSIAVAGPFALVAPLILRAYGKGFATGTPAFRMIVLAYAIGAVTMVFRSTLLSLGKAWLQNVHAAFWGAALIASFFFLRGFGALGLGISYAIAYLVLLVIQTVVVFWKVHQLEGEQTV